MVGRGPVKRCGGQHRQVAVLHLGGERSPHRSTVAARGELAISVPLNGQKRGGLLCRSGKELGDAAREVEEHEAADSHAGDDQR